MDLPDDPLKALRNLSQREMVPDLEDLDRRKAARAQRQRHTSLLVGLVVASLILALVTAGYLVGSGHGQPAARRGSQPAGSPQSGSLPEGALLLRSGNSSLRVDAGQTQPSSLGKVHVLQASPDGTSILATVETTYQYSGSPGSEGVNSTFQTELVQIDAATSGEQSLLSVPSDQSFFGPTSYSPDGKSVAYGLASFGADISSTSPGNTRESDSVCVLDLASGHHECFGSMTAVTWFAWDPSGRYLVVQQTGEDPTAILDVQTGSTTVAMPPGGGPSLLAALGKEAEGGISNISAPVWSPSGKYLAAAVQAVPGGSIPVIFTPSGDVVAVGSPNEDAQVLTWDPVSDVLAYSMGISVPATSSGWIESLTPDGAAPNVLVRADEVGSPIMGFAWSPSGRWLAISRLEGGIEIVDEHDPVGSTIVLDTHGDLAAWSN